MSEPHPSRADRMRAALTNALQPVSLTIDDESARHAGHAGAAPGGETHYTVRIVSASFEGQSRVARQRMAYAALAAEFAAGLHALSLDLRTPAEAATA